MDNIKFKIPFTVLAVCIGILIGLLFYESANPCVNRPLVGCGAGIMLSAILIGVVGLQNTKRQITSVRIVSTIFLIITIIANTIFASVVIKNIYYIIINALILIAWVMIVMSTLNASDTQDKSNRVNPYNN